MMSSKVGRPGGGQDIRRVLDDSIDSRVRSTDIQLQPGAQ
jgi:hypothetical protein